jgi:hypothetical protein
MTARPLPESALARFIPSNEAMKPGPGDGPAALPSVEDSYRMGRDYALGGPNEDNSNAANVPLSITVVNGVKDPLQVGTSVTCIPFFRPHTP